MTPGYLVEISKPFHLITNKLLISVFTFGLSIAKTYLNNTFSFSKANNIFHIIKHSITNLTMSSISNLKMDLMYIIKTVPSEFSTIEES
jgi:hypothetical protein